ncbi:MAG TPA: class I adenylate-forming enzyme family protein [Nitrososphaerales archaeon]|nr:class I adenylate-forming enzyme family protein [Nitrososphaerales archaeon]
MLLQDCLSLAAKDLTCIIDGERSFSSGEFDSLTSQFAADFASNYKIQKRDRIAILLPNSWQFVAAFYASLKAGAIPVPIDYRSSQREINFFLKESGASLLVADAAKHDFIKSSKDSPPQEADLIQTLEVPSDPDADPYDFIGEHGATERIGKVETPIASHDPACILFTGGTTGISKGVVLSHDNVLAVQSRLSNAWALKRGSETFAQILPMTHSGGLNCGVNCAIFTGSRTVILRKFDPVKLLEAIEKYKVTVFAGVPTVYVSLLREDSILTNRDISSLKICFCSGSALSAETFMSFEKKTGIRINVGWGLTEAAPQLTVVPLNHTVAFDQLYVGVPLPDTRIVALGDDGETLLGKDEVGELAAKGPQVMKGYWKDREMAGAFTKDGWLRTGDVGFVATEGVYLLGRKKDVINSSGFKIWPHEVESTLLENQHVMEAAVVGIRDEERGEVAVAFVVLKSETTEGELRDFCKARLTTYKVPRKFIFREALPKSSVGKILRRILREQEEGKNN